jgi:hypothetical protein
LPSLSENKWSTVCGTVAAAATATVMPAAAARPVEPTGGGGVSL